MDFNFLGVGIPELLIVLIVMLIVVGPERLPEVAVQVGRAVRELRRYANQFRSEFMGEFGDIRAEWEMSQQEYSEARRQLREAQEHVAAETQEASSDVARAVGDVNAALRAPIDSTARLKPDEPPASVAGTDETVGRHQQDGASPAAEGEPPAAPKLQRH